MILGQRNHVHANDAVSTFFGHCVWYVCAGEERERGEKARERTRERYFTGFPSHPAVTKVDSLLRAPSRSFSEVSVQFSRRFPSSFGVF